MNPLSHIPAQGLGRIDCGLRLLGLAGLQIGQTLAKILNPLSQLPAQGLGGIDCGLRLLGLAG
ncbi:MAG TPA: hypothetical protein DEB40_11325, partial [Elusimicrobia bacterium]|nr:hypothetical protein [Elusimicrobiota bacterium]